MRLFEAIAGALGRPVAGSAAAGPAAAQPAPRSVAGASSGAASPALNSAPPAAGDTLERVAQADLSAKHGRAVGAAPDLVAQWRTSTLAETLIAIAVDDVFTASKTDRALSRAIMREVADTVAKVEAEARREGQPLDAEARKAVEADALYDALRRRAAPQLPAYEATYARTAVERETLIAGALQAGRADVPSKFRHLANIVATDPTVRAKQRARETLVFENKDVVVVADARVPHKVLVLPTRPGVSFLADLTPAELQGLSRVAGAIERAMAAFAGAPTEVWVNAPQDITQSHLHVHVQPTVAAMDAAAITAMQAAVRGALTRQFP